MDPMSTPSSSLVTETLPDAPATAAAGSGGSGGGGVVSSDDADAGGGGGGGGGSGGVSVSSAAAGVSGGAGEARAPVGVVGAALEVLEVEQVGVNDDNGDALGNDNGDDDNASENAEDYDKAADVSRAMLERTRYRFFSSFLFFPSSLASRSMQLAHPPKTKQTNTKTILCTTTNPLHNNQKKTARH